MAGWLKVLIFVAAIMVLGSLGVRANNGLELRGNITANDMEREEGYFALAQDTVLMVRPGSEAHRWLNANQGKTVRLTLEPAGH